MTILASNVVAAAVIACGAQSDFMVRSDMCVEMLSSPAVAFTQTDRFSVPPGRSSTEARQPNQWHGVFATTRKAQGAEFVALMRIGADCEQSASSSSAAKRVRGGWEVAVDGRLVKLAG